MENSLSPTESNRIPHMSITSQPLWQWLIYEVEKLQKHNNINIVIEYMNKNFSKKILWTSASLVHHKVSRFGNTKYEFTCPVCVFEKKEKFMLGHTTEIEIARWVREGGGFVVKLDCYNKTFEIQMKDIFSGIVEVWQATSDTHVPHDWYAVFGI